MENDFNKNDKQVFFNCIKGEISELNNGGVWCSLTLIVGHENPRSVNFSVKKDKFDKILSSHKIKDKVSVKYFISSMYKNNRWHTNANLLGIELVKD
jgi:hypothetical protein